MISVAEAISDLLYVRDTVVVPGLGAFYKKPLPASVNPVANYFAMPSSIIEFDANLREDNDLVVSYLSEKNGIPEEEARKVLAMFVSDCFNTLKASKKVVLNDVGVLSYDWSGNLAFEPDNGVNYNSDSFGLSDFTMQPVLRSKTKVEIKAEIERQQKDKNTPVTVDEKSVHEFVRDDDDDDEPHSRIWLWILLGLCFVGSLLYGLYALDIIVLPREKETSRLVLSTPRTYLLPTYTKEWKWREFEANDTIRKENVIATHVAQDTIQFQAHKVDTRHDTIVPPQPEKPIVNPRIDTSTNAAIRVIAGCFAQEENAQRLAGTLKDKGYPNAFYEKRGTKWYVSFGLYASDEEAKTVWNEIRIKGEYKAWILK